MTKKEVQDLFKRNLRLFSVYFDTGNLKLKFQEKHPETDEYRAVAWFDVRDNTINILNRAVRDFHIDVITGLLIHEIGHAVDKNLDSSKVEQRADDLAELCTGKRISYTEDHFLQTVGAGIWPRPKSLHQ